MQKYNIKETTNKKGNMKKYLKSYYQNGKIVRFDSYSNGRIDVIHLADYEENKRYLFPFSEGGGYYPTYTYVTCYEGDFVYEEYMVDGNQIVYGQYSMRKDEVLYTEVNYVRNGTYKELNRYAGIIKDEDVMEFTILENHSWLDERKE